MSVRNDLWSIELRLKALRQDAEEAYKKAELKSPAETSFYKISTELKTLEHDVRLAKVQLDNLIEEL